MPRTRSLGDFFDSPFGGFNFSGGAAGGFGLGSGGLGGSLGLGASGGFDFSNFGGVGQDNRFGLDLGYHGLDLDLDLFEDQLGKHGSGGRVTWEVVRDVITTLSPIIAALFGRERQYAASRGAIPATGAAAPPGYTRIQNPETGEQLDVPEDLADQYAQRYTDAYNASAGGISTTTLLVGVGIVGAFWWANRRKADSAGGSR